MEYKVYIHINKINNKKYIGMTSQSLKQRWRNGKGYKTNIAFSNAISKYGWNNFDHDILAKNLNKKQAEKLEMFFIRFYKTQNKKYGYNIESGGNSIGSHSSETKNKISKSKEKEVICLNTGIIYNSMTIASLCLKINVSSLSMVCNKLRKSVGGLSFMFLSDFKQASIKDILKKLDIKPKNSKKIICLNDKRVFNQIVEAGMFYNINPIYICNICKGKQKTSKGLTFKYFEEFSK